MEIDRICFLEKLKPSFYRIYKFIKFVLFTFSNTYTIIIVAHYIKDFERRSLSENSLRRNDLIWALQKRAIEAE